MLDANPKGAKIVILPHEVSEFHSGVFKKKRKFQFELRAIDGRRIPLADFDYSYSVKPEGGVEIEDTRKPYQISFTAEDTSFSIPKTKFHFSLAGIDKWVLFT